MVSDLVGQRVMLDDYDGPKGIGIIRAIYVVDGAVQYTIERVHTRRLLYKQAHQFVLLPETPKPLALA